MIIITVCMYVCMVVIQLLVDFAGTNSYMYMHVHVCNIKYSFFFFYSCIHSIGYSTDILGIVDRASKEVAIEELLKNLEEVWLSMQFQLKPFYRLHGHEQVKYKLKQGYFIFFLFYAQAVSDIGVEAGRISALSHVSPVVRKRSISSGRVSIISVTPTVAVERMTHHHQQEVVMLLDDVDKIFEALDHYQVKIKYHIFLCMYRLPPILLHFCYILISLCSVESLS